MGFHYSPKAVADNSLVLAFDAINPKSFNGGTTVTDLSRTGNNCTLNSVSANAEGTFDFGGSGSTTGSPAGEHITVPAISVQNSPLGLTYEIWIYPTVNGRRSLFFGSGTINHVEVYCGSAGGSFRTEARNQNGYSFGASSPPGGIPINTWTMINIVWDVDGATRPVRWYKNGELFYTHANFYSGNAGTGEDFWFTGLGRATGSVNYTYAQSFAGKMNGLRIYQRKLSDAEVLNNFEAHKTRYGL
jgi:hypothetical protein